MAKKSGQNDPHQDVFDCRLRRPIDGFDWVFSRFIKGDSVSPYVAPEEWVLAPRANAAEEFNPLLDAPGLAMEFANLRPDQEAILKFANRFGWLGQTRHLYPNFLMLGEELSVWQKEIREVAHLARVWNLLQLSDKKHLGEIIRYERTFWHAIDPEWGSKRIDPIRGRIFPPGDPRGPARLHCQRLINLGLGRGKVRPFLLYDSAWKGHVIDVVAETLQGVIWLQLARLMAGIDGLRRCETCGKWMKLGHSDDARTARRRFCDVTCRVRAYKDRQASGPRPGRKPRL